MSYYINGHLNNWSTAGTGPKKPLMGLGPRSDDRQRPVVVLNDNRLKLCFGHWFFVLGFIDNW